jgi:hypothetical protein
MSLAVGRLIRWPGVLRRRVIGHALGQ